MLSTKLPRPRSSGSSSLRLTGDADLAPVSVALMTHSRGSGDRLDDVVVARAAAEVALEAVPDRFSARRLAIVDQRDGRHHHARRAVSALERVVIVERLLHRVQLPVRGEALDRRDLGAVGLDAEDGARLHRLAVEQHRAGAARGRVAADGRAREREPLTQDVNQQITRLDLELVLRAVDGQGNRVATTTSFARGGRRAYSSRGSTRPREAVYGCG